MDKLLLMMQLQNQLNEATNGEDWTKGITKNGKTINWKRCIYMECAEMIDSFAWKHWKSINKEPDWDNLQIEVVDVWHFVISLAIEHYSTKMLGTLENLAINVSESQSYKTIETDEIHFAPQSKVIEKVETLMRLSLAKELEDINEVFEEFFELVLMSGLNLETLYRLYVGKNVLNQFRQDNGYKDGSYIKEWAGEEDNVIMKRIWEENSDIKPDALYKELAKLYTSLNRT